MWVVDVNFGVWWNVWVWVVGVVTGGGCGQWVWVESMGVAPGCSCKEVYRFPHTTYPYSSCICSFLQQHPYFLFIKKNVFSFLFQYFFVIIFYVFNNFFTQYKHKYGQLRASTGITRVQLLVRLTVLYMKKHTQTYASYPVIDISCINML